MHKSGACIFVLVVPFCGLKAFAEQVRRLDEERACVAAEAGDELGCEGVRARVVQIVVVAGVEGGPRTRRPAKQCLRS